ncbi:acyl-CoA thioester hydrolase/BAAT C-terminal domain-containing protein, partial [Corynebacterium sp. HMSC068G04]|uniref:acyl-CoA thioester hydrolase/BAAT C-terminal domain-containing protein n=1 Tax=Corynebacterium sp. HMSC068G04 TaxID=1739497 RepID=UPI00352ADC37
MHRRGSVPLEFFDEVLAYAKEHGNGSAPLTIVGTSKGAELTANLAACYPQINNIVLYTPAHHTYGSLTYQRGSGSTSSFSWRGEPVPFAKLQGTEKGKVM